MLAFVNILKFMQYEHDVEGRFFVFFILPRHNKQTCDCLFVLTFTLVALQLINFLLN